MPFQIIRNDITKVEADAIVNSANPLPIAGNGTDGAIYEAAGHDELLAERKKIGPMERGNIAVTPAFALKAKYIIHTVGPIWEGGNDGEYEALRSCYSKSLNKALELGCESIAFPMISTGVYDFPKDEALQIAIGEVSKFLMKNDMMVYLVVFDERAFKLSNNIVGEVQTYISSNYVKEQSRSEYAIRGTAFRTRRFKDEEQFMTPDEIAELDRVNNRIKHPNLVTNSGAIERNTEATFQEKLFDLIAERNLSNTEVYTLANLDRKHFSKIQCNKNYHPSKKTAMALCIALKLNMEQSKDLLSRAGWAFNPSSKVDLIVQNAIANKKYDIHLLNAELFAFTEETLGV